MHPDITIVACCADFDDYLGRVISSWKKMKCHEIIVVTPIDDFNTIEFCEKHDLTSLIVERPEQFIRGYYLNAGLRQVKTEWTLILDSDCYVTLSEPIDTSNLKKTDMHGLPHRTVNIQALEKYKNSKILPRGKTYGLCMGFFQLFNTNERIRRNKWYNEKYNVFPNGKGADWHFARRWGKSRISDDILLCISNTTNRFGRVANRISSVCYSANHANTKEKLLESKLQYIKKFTDYERGIKIYEK